MVPQCIMKQGDSKQRNTASSWCCYRHDDAWCHQLFWACCRTELLLRKCTCFNRIHKNFLCTPHTNPVGRHWIHRFLPSFYSRSIHILFQSPCRRRLLQPPLFHPIWNFPKWKKKFVPSGPLKRLLLLKIVWVMNEAMRCVEPCVFFNLILVLPN